MQTLRYVHRYATVLIVVIVLFLGITGVLIQMVDLRSIALGRPAGDPDVLAMREAFDGPEDFVVRQAADYTAPTLPAAFDYAEALRAALRTARGAVGPTPLRFLEFRVVGKGPSAVVGVGSGHLRIDPIAGRVVERTDRDAHDTQQPVSLRNNFKHLHRMTAFGDWALAINLVASVALAVLIVTGVLIYAKLFRARRRMRKTSPFWSAGGTWRMLHRSISIVAALFLAVVTLSGAWLAVESAGLAVYFLRHAPAPPAPPTPLVDADLPAALRTTLSAYRRDGGPGDVVVLRLRSYGPYLQGIVVTGGGSSRQLVYDARSGGRMGLSAPGYPEVPFPFGWQAHQMAKSIHRGDVLGIGGRVVDLLSGLAMIYLGASGIQMYWTMWRKRIRGGRKGLVWR